MTISENKLNGSVDLFARAMHAVIKDAVNEAIGPLGCEISTLGGRISTLGGRISSLEGKVSSLEGKVSSLEGKVLSLEGKVASLDGRVSSMEDKMSSMEDNMLAMEERLSNEFNNAIKTTNENMQAQFAVQEKKIAEIARLVQSQEAFH